MDENINEVQELSEPIDENEFVGDELTEEEEAMWDEDDDSESLTDDSTEDFDEADQPTSDETETADGQAETETQATDADQYLELKHFDEVRKVSKEEAKTLAQMGMDYPRIKNQLAEARTELEKLRDHEKFLEELKGGFNTVDELVADTRANIMSQRENISKDVAKERIASMAQRQQEEANREDPVVTAEKQSLTLFTELYPDVKAADIPQEVWDDFKVTHSLVASWARFDAKNVKKDNDVLKQNAKNKQRSVGSMKSSGNNNRDDIDDMWYNDDY